MKRFARTLRELDQRLVLPPAARNRLLLEIAADLEDSFEHYRSQGLSEEAAKGQALKGFDLSSEALSELVRLHASASPRGFGGFLEQARTLWERSLLLLLLLMILALNGRYLLGSALYRTAGPMAAPAVLVGLVAMGIGLAKAYQIYLRRDHHPRRLRSWLPVVRSMSWIVLAASLAMIWIDLYTVVRRIVAEELAPGLVAVPWLHRSSANLMLGFFFALVAALLWFMMSGTVVRIEETQASLLFEEKGGAT